MSNEIKQAMNPELPKVICAMSLIYIPTIVESTICPHCGKLNIDYYNDDSKNIELLTSCLECDKDYKIIIPDFKIVNEKVICL